MSFFLIITFAGIVVNTNHNLSFRLNLSLPLKMQGEVSFLQENDGGDFSLKIIVFG